MTPEVLSRSQSNERTSLDVREDEEQEAEQYIQPPSQDYLSLPQGNRLAADEDPIIIDDSDEEEGAKQIEGSRASPQSEKDELCDSPGEPDTDVIDVSSVPQEPLVDPLNFEQASQLIEALQMPGSDITQEQDGESPSPLEFFSLILNHNSQR